MAIFLTGSTGYIGAHVAANKLGLKTGSGFYDYAGEAPRENPAAPTRSSTVTAPHSTPRYKASLLTS